MACVIEHLELRRCPTAIPSIVPIAPDPRITAVGDVTIQFSEAVSGVDILDFTLERTVNGVTDNVGLNGLIVVAMSATNYVLNLSTVTASEGAYVVTLVAAGSGITSIGSGDPLLQNAADDWIFASTFVSVSGGNVTLSDPGLPNNQLLTLRIVGAELEINDSNNELAAEPGTIQGGDSRTVLVPLPLAGTMAINAAGGNDFLTLDFSAGNWLPPGGLTIDGGPGGIDELVLDRVVNVFDSAAISYTSPTSGSIALRTGTPSTFFIRYLGLGTAPGTTSPVTINDSPPNFEFNLTNSHDADARLSFNGTTGLTRLSGINFGNTDFSLASVTSLTINGLAGNDKITVAGLDPAYSGSLTMNGGDGHDALKTMLSNFAVTLVGGNGNDTLTAQGGDDSLVGDAGNDMLIAGGGHDRLSGGLGNDNLNASAGANDTLIETANSNLTLKDFSLTGIGSDVLNGFEHAVLTGGSSANRLDAGAFTRGAVTLFGLAGDDTLIGTAKVDSLNGDLGADRVEEIVSGVIEVRDAEMESISGIEPLISIETISLTGDVGNDFIDASTFPRAVTLFGGFGDDSLVGGTGGSVLSGNNGNDTLIGGPSSDSLLGGAGSDSLVGDAGNDRLRGQDGNDTIIGGLGRDTIEGDSGADDLSGGDDDDVLIGGLGSDTIRGDDGHDSLNGNDGDDSLQGADGNDTMLGGAGADVLSGNDGDDSLNGQGGIDSVTGGDGSDVFRDSLAEIIDAFAEGFDDLFLGPL